VPSGRLLLSGKNLFGVTQKGGAYNEGAVFELQLN